MAIETLPAWASDLSWIEDAYRTDQEQIRIGQIAWKIFSSKIRNPELLKKVYEMIQWGVERDITYAKSSLCFWRTYGFGRFSRESSALLNIESAPTTINNCSIKCKILKDPSPAQKRKILEALLEIIRIDQIIQQLALFNLSEIGNIGNLGDLLATMSNLTKLKIEISKIPSSDICKLFSSIQRSHSIEELEFSSSSLHRFIMEHTPSFQFINTLSAEEIKRSVALMFKENKSLKEVRFIYPPFRSCIEMNAFVEGLCSISENTSIQKLTIKDFRTDVMGEEGVPDPHALKLDDFFASLARNRSLRVLELNTDLQVSDIITLLNLFKIHFSNNLQTLFIKPVLTTSHSSIFKPFVRDEILSFFNKLAENRAIQKLIFDWEWLHKAFFRPEDELLFWLASNNRIFQSFELQWYSRPLVIDARIVSKLEENKKEHPSMQYMLWDCV